jgi:hypothetical protein
VAILPVLFLTRLAAVVSCLARATRELGTACLALGAVFVVSVDLFFVHRQKSTNDDQISE